MVLSHFAGILALVYGHSYSLAVLRNVEGYDNPYKVVFQYRYHRYVDLRELSGIRKVSLKRARSPLVLADNVTFAAKVVASS